MTSERLQEIERIVGEQFFNETERDVVREIIAEVRRLTAERDEARSELRDLREASFQGGQ